MDVPQPRLLTEVLIGGLVIIIVLSVVSNITTETVGSGSGNGTISNITSSNYPLARILLNLVPLLVVVVGVVGLLMYLFSGSVVT